MTSQRKHRVETALVAVLAGISSAGVALVGFNATAPDECDLDVYCVESFEDNVQMCWHDFPRVTDDTFRAECLEVASQEWDRPVGDFRDARP